jgi:hypothetical protein
MRGRPATARCGEASSAGGDCCRPAVRRTYRELCDRGQPERFAFEAAVTVYLWHHPEVVGTQAHDIVSRWLWNGVSH